MTRELWSVLPDAERLLATFRLEPDGRVTATYHDALTERRLTRDGVWTRASGIVRPSDGRAFLDALPDAFANSSLIDVR